MWTSSQTMRTANPYNQKQTLCLGQSSDCLYINEENKVTGVFSKICDILKMYERHFGMVIIMNMDWIQECFPEYQILIEYDNIDDKKNRQEIHGLKDQNNVICMFCTTPFSKWSKRDIAHAISECVGNKALINFCECYDCNHLFGEIAENHLGKFIMPYRIINEVYGKGKFRNVVKDMPVDENLSYGSYRFEQKKNAPVFQSDSFEVYNMLIEKGGTGRFTKTKDGFRLSIPRQNYDPHLAYASFLKMAYTILPPNELKYYQKELCKLYLALSLKAFYDEDGNEIVPGLSESDKQEYLNCLPNFGIEICISNTSIPSGVNICLLKRSCESELEPKLLFAIQMQWHTIVIPILSDDYNSGENVNIKVRCNERVTIRKIDFSQVENEFICEMTGKQIDIPKELFPELEEALRDNGLLKNE